MYLSTNSRRHEKTKSFAIRFSAPLPSQSKTPHSTSTGNSLFSDGPDKHTLTTNCRPFNPSLPPTTLHDVSVQTVPMSLPLTNPHDRRGLHGGHERRGEKEKQRGHSKIPHHKKKKSPLFTPLESMDFEFSRRLFKSLRPPHPKESEKSPPFRKSFHSSPLSPPPSGLSLKEIFSLIHQSLSSHKFSNGILHSVRSFYLRRRNAKNHSEGGGEGNDKICREGGLWMTMREFNDFLTEFHIILSPNQSEVLREIFSFPQNFTSSPPSSSPSPSSSSSLMNFTYFLTALFPSLDFVEFERKQRNQMEILQKSQEEKRNSEEMKISADAQRLREKKNFKKIQKILGEISEKQTGQHEEKQQTQRHTNTNSSVSLHSPPPPPPPLSFAVDSLQLNFPSANQSPVIINFPPPPPPPQRVLEAVEDSRGNFHLHMRDEKEKERRRGRGNSQNVPPFVGSFAFGNSLLESSLSLSERESHRRGRGERKERETMKSPFRSTFMSKYHPESANEIIDTQRDIAIDAPIPLPSSLVNPKHTREWKNHSNSPRRPSTAYDGQFKSPPSFMLPKPQRQRDFATGEAKKWEIQMKAKQNKEF